MTNARAWWVAFALLGLVFAFTGCGGDDDDDSSGGDDTGDDDASDDDASDDDVGDDDSSDDDTWPPLPDDDTGGPGDPDLGDWRFIHDANNRAMVLRGCNFDGNAKGADGLPHRTDEELEDMAGNWGFNFMRYLVFWARIEPDQPGVYDEDYLDAVEEWLDKMAANNVRVVLDMHQDVWGPFVRMDSEDSDGAPEWATVTDGMPHIPFSQYLGMWAADYLSPDVNRAFDNFWNYDKHPELQDAYAAMWAHVAERFGNHPAVLGYDIMNEPWQASGMFHYQEFDQTRYSNFLQRMINAIRAVDDVGWVFYEPTAFLTNQGGPQFLRVLDDPREGPDHLAYFPHLYPVWIDLTGGFDPALDHTLGTWEYRRRNDAARQHAPILAGEWSMLAWHGEDDLFDWTTRALAMLERVTSGWTYWDCGGFLRESYTDDYRALIASVYPRAVAGHPTAYGYDPAARVFTLSFEERDGVTGPTEIFVPAEREYPDGFAVTSTDPDGSWSYEWDEDARVLSVVADPGSAAHTVTIVPEE